MIPGSSDHHSFAETLRRRVLAPPCHGLAQSVFSAPPRNLFPELSAQTVRRHATVSTK